MARNGESWLEWPEGANLAATMPKWWTPDHRETYRDKRDGTYVPAKWVSQGCTPFDALASHYERITADLTTGAEIPA